MRKKWKEGYLKGGKMGNEEGRPREGNAREAGREEKEEEGRDGWE